MKISIVIPCFNGENRIAETIDSALASFKRTQCEIVCVDDCSTAGTLQVLEGLKAKHGDVIQVVHHEVNGGANESRRTGSLAATGDHIVFLDNDDRLVAESIDKLADVLEKKPVDILFYGTKYLEEPDVENNETLKEKKRGFDATIQGYKLATSKKRIMDAIFSPAALECAPIVWAKVYTKEFVVDGFSVIPKGWCLAEEDNCELLAFLAASKTVSYCDIIGYEYRFDSGVTARAIDARESIRCLRNNLFVARFGVEFKKRFADNPEYMRYVDVVCGPWACYWYECIINWLTQEYKDREDLVLRSTLGDPDLKWSALLFYQREQQARKRMALLDSIKSNEWLLRPFIKLLLSAIGLGAKLSRDKSNKERLLGLKSDVKELLLPKR